jgi:hypothetical protein
MADINLIVKKTSVSREHDQPSTSNRHIVSHKVVSSSPLYGWELNYIPNIIGVSH